MQGRSSADSEVVEHVSSIIDDRAVDPHAAEAVLARLELRQRAGLIGSGVAIAAAVVAFPLTGPALAIACVLGSMIGLVVAGLARSDRASLLQRLVGQRSAYAIPAESPAPLAQPCNPENRQ